MSAKENRFEGFKQNTSKYEGPVRARVRSRKREIESSKPPPSPMKKKNGEVKLSVAPKKVAIQGASAPAAAPAAPAEPAEQRASASSSLELCSSA